jgi:hypothetical protein
MDADGRVTNGHVELETLTQTNFLSLKIKTCIICAKKAPMKTLDDILPKGVVDVETLKKTASDSADMPPKKERKTAKATGRKGSEADARPSAGAASSAVGAGEKADFSERPPTPQNQICAPRGVSVVRPGSDFLDACEGSGFDCDSREVLSVGCECGLSWDQAKYLCWLLWDWNVGGIGLDGCPWGPSARMRLNRVLKVKEIRDIASARGLLGGRIADADEVMEQYTEVMRDGSLPTTQRLDAMKALGNRYGLFKDVAGEKGGMTVVIVDPYGGGHG